MSVKNNVFVVGLTGMSGAGKSTACELFANAGFKIIDCDQISHEVTKQGTPCLAEIAECFGASVLNDDGSLNRHEMARLVYSDEEKKLLLNNIIFPFITYIVIRNIMTEKNIRVMLDAPTLFESGINDICDRIVSIVAPANLLVQRITKRDGISKEVAQARLSAQHTASFYRDRSNFTLENNGSLDEFITDIKATINVLRSENDQR